ncbi:EamA/RhaT family transporter [Pseudomonas sp. Choline-3u-10]|jgi:drug/metabolite transporter (DMT)-like permease|uniref:DMT family transporter n=1 Tax=Pseudomonadaceae TaxID=135621 RepID=UPI000617C9D7|nr:MULTISPECIES: DMT family transporter [Pseudomonadaceae]MBU0949729.1 DMT family transporter [Gammaproteobacteria bacterium]HBM07610.1 EamA/RhaT family transporter [Pseudomonas sp.]KJJ61400.1 membrane protein [Pseudomonas sp. 10B238]MBK3797127.1 EamA family transporter [Stutzerimonas stutzeri]MBK3877630.1 EamA family transporter [Stutzerimonas stutzeri]
MTHRNALLAIHFGALMFGLSGVFGKLADSTPLIITLGRAGFAVVALLLAAQFLRSGGAAPSLRQRAGLLLGGLLLGGHWLTFFIAVKIAGVGIATLGFASFPAFTVLLEGVLFRERTRPVEFGMVALVCVGLLLVTPQFDLASESTLGLIYGILSGLMFALLSLLNRAVTRGVDPVQAALWQNCIILLCLLPFSWSSLPAVPAMDWLWLALLGVLCTGLAHSLFVASLKVLKARTTSVIFSLEPVYGIAIAWWLFNEQPSLGMLAGGALIILASVITSRLKAPSAVTAASPLAKTP